jgi:hypothetical protein
MVSDSGRQYQKSLLVFSAMQLWLFGTGTCTLWAVLGSEVAFLTMIALVFSAIVALRGNSSWLVTAMATLIVALAGNGTASVDRCQYVSVELLPVYVATVLLWSVQRMCNVFGTFRAYERPIVSGMVSFNALVFLTPGTATIDPAPAVSQFFHDTMYTLVWLSLLSLIIEATIAGWRWLRYLDRQPFTP